ncbi:hypothetical protein ACOKS3_18060 [Pseudomonas sp. HS6-2]
MADKDFLALDIEAWQVVLNVQVDAYSQSGGVGYIARNSVIGGFDQY